MLSSTIKRRKRKSFLGGEKLFNQSRKVVALGLATALVGTGVAVAGDPTGAELNEAQVVGDVTPTKLDKKKRKPVDLFLGVVNSPDSAGDPTGNAASELISVSKNVKVNLSKAPVCDEPLANGSTTEFARETCPKKSYLGGGDAVVFGPGFLCNPPQDEPCKGADLIVSVFNGPGPGQLRLHTYDPNPDGLGESAPIVNAAIVNSDEPGFGQALSVPAAPETAFLKITEFNATVKKSTGVATARCKSKNMDFLREVTYTDGSSETAELSTKCKRR